MEGITELAKLFKARDNVSIQGISVGTVVSELPEFKISVNGFMLDKEDLVVADGVDRLRVGTSVIVMPSAENQVYFVLSKVGDM